MNISIIVVQYYLDDAPLRTQIAAFKSILARAGVGATEHIVDIRNRHDAGSTEASDQLRYFDISGYEKGLRDLDSTGVAICLNDTLFTKHPWKLMLQRLIQLLPLLASLEVPAAAGAVHPTTDILMLDTQNATRRHLSTFLFAANGRGVDEFRRLTAPLSSATDAYDANWLSRQRSTSPELSLLLQVHLGHARNPWSWHGLAVHSDADLIERKGVTVAVEYLYTRGLLQAGGCVLPINVGLKFKSQAFLSQLFRRVFK